MFQVDILDIECFVVYLEVNVVGFKGLIIVDKFEGGQFNFIFYIKVVFGEYVLCCQLLGKLFKFVYVVDWEFWVMNVFQNIDVLVLCMYYLCEDCDVVGFMFYIMEFCQGWIFWDVVILEVDNVQCIVMYDEMNWVLVVLYGVDVDVVGFVDYGKLGNYFECQMGCWFKQYCVFEINYIQVMEDLMVWLENNQFVDDGQVFLVYGDYCFDNMMWYFIEFCVIVVFDWELFIFGYLFVDFVYQCMQLCMFQEGGNLFGLQGKDCKLLGIFIEQEYV